jgi:hypothetical protein
VDDVLSDSVRQSVGRLVTFAVIHTSTTESRPKGGGEDDIRGFSLCLLDLFPSGTPATLTYVNKPKVFVASEAHHVVLTARIRVNGMLRPAETAGREHGVAALQEQA